MARAHPESISPTAHYTGYVWYANGLSHDAFASRTGHLMYQALRGPNAIARRIGGPSLEDMLLARHRLLDERLAAAIDAGTVGQVVEIAAGLSPRGWRFARRYGDRLTYVEADLPAMIAHKRRILAELGGETAHHRTAEIDALSNESVAELFGTLAPDVGTAILTEGLVNYFDRETLVEMWRRFAAALARFPHGRYYSDLILGDAENRGALVTSFSWLLSAFVRGKVHVHFESADDAEAALADAGLPGQVLDPRAFGNGDPGAARVRVIEASRPST